MRYITIHEGEIITLDEDTLSDAHKMIADEPSLPMWIRDNRLGFNDYIVGAIQVGDLNIEILPRNASVNLEALFEMLLYESLNNFDENYTSGGFGDNQSFGVASITSQFYYECVKLLDFGLTGGFIREEHVGREINGRIIMEKFSPPSIAVDGIWYESDEYTVNVPANQIIKTAICKVLQFETRIDVRRKYTTLSKGFDYVEEYSGSLDGIEDIYNTFYSANPNYPIALEFAIKILKEMKLKYNNGKVQWYAFLHNSNDIFEKYVRKVLSKGLDAYVTKWEEPKQIAALSDGIRSGFKSYVPDILIDYDPITEKAKAVLDAKNKRFEPNRGSFSDVLSSADMYQMTFYCDKLKTNLGGLIYPGDRDNAPVTVAIDGNQDFRFVLFSINMKERIGSRHRKLCNAIKEHLLYYIQ